MTETVPKANHFDITARGAFSVRVGELRIEGRENGSVFLAYKGRAVETTGKLTELPERILNILGRNAGKIVPTHKLLYGLYGSRTHLPEFSLIKVQIFHIRTFLRKQFSKEVAALLRNVWGYGYYLNDTEIKVSKHARPTVRERTDLRGFKNIKRHFES